jgi:hypothetical protein
MVRATYAVLRTTRTVANYVGRGFFAAIHTHETCSSPSQFANSIQSARCRRRPVVTALTWVTVGVSGTPERRRPDCSIRCSVRAGSEFQEHPPRRPGVGQIHLRVARRSESRPFRRRGRSDRLSVKRHGDRDIGAHLVVTLNTAPRSTGNRLWATMQFPHHRATCAAVQTSTASHLRRSRVLISGVSAFLEAERPCPRSSVFVASSPFAS